jgi:hypothetical protein
MKPGVVNSQTQSRDKGMEVEADTNAVRPGSAPSDGTRCARGEANPVANSGAKKMSKELDKGKRKPTTPRWCPRGLSKTQQ